MRILLFFCWFGWVQAVPLDHIFDDTNYVWEDYSIEKVKCFLAFFPKNRMSDSQIEYVYEYCQRKNISIEVVFARMQGEQGVIVNLQDTDNKRRLDWCMSFGLFIGLHWATYESQVSNGINLMADRFKSFRVGQTVKVDVNGRTLWVAPKNGSTYAIHSYNPVWDFAMNHSKINVGNRLFLDVWLGFRPYWQKIH